MSAQSCIRGLRADQWSSGCCCSPKLSKRGVPLSSWRTSGPRVPGHEVIGRIDAVGSDVKTRSVGQCVGVGIFGERDDIDRLLPPYTPEKVQALSQWMDY